MRNSLLVAALLSSSQISAQAPVKGECVIHVLAANDKNEIIAESVESPVLGFRVEEGKVDGPGVYDCEQNTEMRSINISAVPLAGDTRQKVEYPVVVLRCGGIKLVLTGMDLRVKK
jgi:hypothetical protein